MTRICTAVLGVIAFATTASAQTELFVDVDSRGSTTRAAAPGETVQVSVRTDAVKGASFNSAVFRIVFTEPDLSLLGYVWDMPFETGTILDGSLANATAFPVDITNELVEGPLLPADTPDIDFDNFLLAGDYDSGELVRFTVRVPAGYAYRGSIFVAVVPDTFALGFVPLETEVGTLLEIIVEETSPSDVNRDGRVNGADLSIILSAWNTDGTPAEFDRPYDIDGSGNVDGADLTLILANWTG